MCRLSALSRCSYRCIFLRSCSCFLFSLLSSGSWFEILKNDCFCLRICTLLITISFCTLLENCTQCSGKCPVRISLVQGAGTLGYREYISHGNHTIEASHKQQFRYNFKRKSIQAFSMFLYNVLGKKKTV